MEIESYTLSRPIAHWTDHPPPYLWSHGTIFLDDRVVGVHIENGRMPMTMLWTAYDGRLYSTRFNTAYTKRHCVTLARRFVDEVLISRQ